MNERNGTVSGSAVPFLPFVLKQMHLSMSWAQTWNRILFLFSLKKITKTHNSGQLSDKALKSVFAPVGLLRRHITRESLYLHSFNCLTNSLLQRAELIPAAITNTETTNLESLRSLAVWQDPEQPMQAKWETIANTATHCTPVLTSIITSLNSSVANKLSNSLSVTRLVLIHCQGWWAFTWLIFYQSVQRVFWHGDQQCLSFFDLC